MNSSQTDAKLKEEWRKTRAGVMKRCDEKIKKVGYAKFFFFLHNSLKKTKQTKI